MKRKAAGIVAVLLVLVVGIGLLVFAGSSYQAQVSACTSTGTLYQPVTTSIGSTPTFNEPEQIKHAQLIIGIGLARKLSLRDIKIALMVAMQESHLRNLAYGDRDSLGLFQQRPSVKAWGTAEQIMDPVHATNKFYEELERIINRDSKTLFDVATDVQRPNERLYAKTFGLWDAPATAFLKGVIEGSTTLPADVVSPQEGCTSLLGDVEVAVQAALSQQGKPYQWGSGPSTDSFDCSDLTQWAYKQAGVSLPRVANAQYAFGKKISRPGLGSASEWLAVLQRGDLIYWTPNRLAVTDHDISHVAIYLGDGQMIDAPRAGQVVSVKHVYWFTSSLLFFGATRPIENIVDTSGQHSGWQWPLGSITITSPFGMRRHPITHVYKLHDGVDFRADMLTPVKSAHSGRILFAGVAGGYGNYVTIDHGGGVVTGYAHLSSILVQVGQQVSGGRVIALSGTTGLSTAPHLHFNVRVDDTFVDPIPYMRQFGLVP